MKKIIITTLVLFELLVVSVGLYFWFFHPTGVGQVSPLAETTKQTNTPKPTPEQNSVLQTLPQSFKDDFMENCDKDGTNTSYCSCGLKYLEDTLGPRGFIEMSIEYKKTGIPPQAVIDAAVGCINHSGVI